MTKIVESVRLDDEHRQILKLRTAELGIDKSEYIRFLIDKDNIGRFQKPNSDELTLWQENRAKVLLNDSQIALLKVIKQEFQNKTNQQIKKIKNLDELCEKFGLEKRIARADLENLVKMNILNHTNKDALCEYEWTHEGIFILPEFALIGITDCTILEGDIASLLQKMFGIYLESVRFIQDALKLTKKKAIEIFNLFLSEYVLFFHWLRNYGFGLTGIPVLDDVIYYRKQMMNFLMSYCLMIRDPDFIETDSEFRELSNDLVKRLSNYFIRQKEIRID